MSIYSQIKEKFIMPNAYQDWSKYREKVTRLIVDGVERQVTGYETVNDGLVKKKMVPIYKEDLSIAILGAGSCSDFDLVGIAQHFDEITLIDVDDAGMKKAIEWMPEIFKEKITLKTVSITGITDGDQNNFCEHILKKVSLYGSSMTKEMYNAFLMEELTILDTKLYKEEGDLQKDILPLAGYDVVVCLGVHSQLMSLLTYMIHVLTYNISGQLFRGEAPDDSEIIRYIKDMDKRIIPVINSAILKCSREKAVFGCEYDDENPVEGAYQCIEDLRERGLGIQEQHLVWDFNPNENVVYDMLIQIV